jgi:hypothetical protein
MFHFPLLSKNNTPGFKVLFIFKMMPVPVIRLLGLAGQQEDSADTG